MIPAKSEWKEWKVFRDALVLTHNIVSYCSTFCIFSDFWCIFTSDDYPRFRVSPSTTVHYCTSDSVQITYPIDCRLRTGCWTRCNFLCSNSSLGLGRRSGTCQRQVSFPRTKVGICRRKAVIVCNSEVFLKFAIRLICRLLCMACFFVLPCCLDILNIVHRFGIATRALHCILRQLQTKISRFLLLVHHIFVVGSIRRGVFPFLPAHFCCSSRIWKDTWLGGVTSSTPSVLVIRIWGSCLVLVLSPHLTKFVQITHIFYYTDLIEDWKGNSFQPYPSLYI